MTCFPSLSVCTQLIRGSFCHASPRLETRIQILQHVAFPDGRIALLCCYVRHQLVGCSPHVRHWNPPLHLRDSQEARWAVCVYVCMLASNRNDACTLGLTCQDSCFLPRCELGLVHAGGDICECSQQRSVSFWCRGSCQELQVKVCIAPTWVQEHSMFQNNTVQLLSLTVWHMKN